MSLLMEALKKAEEVKKQTTSGEVGQRIDDFALAPASPIDEPFLEAVISPKMKRPDLNENQALQRELFPSSELESQPLSMTPMDLFMQPEVQTSVAPTEQMKTVPSKEESEAQLQKKAQTILSAKQSSHVSNFVLLTGAGLTFFLLCLMMGVYYWQKTNASAVFPLIKQGQAVMNAASNQVGENPTQEEVAKNSSDELNDNDNALPLTKMNSDYKTELSTTNDLSESVEPPINVHQRDQARQAASIDAIQINKVFVTASTNSDLSAAYEFYTSGDMKSAKIGYEKVLQKDAANRDALLGLAAIALQLNQTDQAAALYSKLLDLNPSDPDAIAGMTGLSHSNPEQRESQLKKVLAEHEQSGAALFELGNLYMQQSRWAEAQEVYFRAFGISPKNADFAFNLAVSLDRLGQVKLAMTYYQQALTLSKAMPAKFNQDSAKNRLAALQAMNP